MALRCTECGDGSKTFESKRQARGHVKFKSGGKHGDSQEVPSDWESLFEEVEGNGDGGSSDADDDASSSSSGGDGSDGSDSGSSSSGGGSDGSSDGESGGSSSESGFLRRIVDTDVRELLRGGS